MSVNKVILLGHLGADPELRYTASQTAVCKMRMATTDRIKDANGEWTDNTEWHTVVAFGKTAENCSKYLSKGSQIYVEGRLKTNKWTDKEGKDRYRTDIVVITVQFLSTKNSTNSGSYQQQSQKDVANSSGGFEQNLDSNQETLRNKSVSFEDDEIPF